MGQKKKGLKVSLLVRILGVAVIPLLLISAIIGVITIKNMREGMRTETMKGLQAQVQSVTAAYDAIAPGDYRVDEENHLWKGEYDISSNVEVIDSFVEGTDMDITLFYGDTRMATSLLDKHTGERIIGTQADESVVKKVIEEDQQVQKYNLTINEEPYYACYAPLKNSDGTTVGMMFAGIPATEAFAFIRQRLSQVVLTIVVISIIAIALAALFAKGIQKAIFTAENAVVELADGQLEMSLTGKVLERNDELGDMARGVAKLLHELVKVVRNINTTSKTLLDAGNELNAMASQTSDAADEISHAVDDISDGALSQANDVETVLEQIEEMGRLIYSIVEHVDGLDNAAGNMREAGARSVAIIEELSESNNRTMEAVGNISQQVNATNDSAVKISAAVDLITSIAEETNLLSLNASIEAARAGEQGRGFAVVAGQIQKLAEQSNESAHTIAQIISDLLKDSQDTVAIMDKVNQIVNEQHQKLQETRKQIIEVDRGIELAKNATGEIKGQTDTCNKAREKVVDVIANLSASAQENAASAQETTASMQGLNETIALMAETAGRLQSLSQEMNEDIAFFKVQGGKAAALK